VPPVHHPEAFARLALAETTAADATAADATDAAAADSETAAADAADAADAAEAAATQRVATAAQSSATHQASAERALVSYSSHSPARAPLTWQHITNYTFLLGGGCDAAVEFFVLRQQGVDELAQGVEGGRGSDLEPEDIEQPLYHNLH